MGSFWLPSRHTFSLTIPHNLMKPSKPMFRIINCFVIAFLILLSQTTQAQTGLVDGQTVNGDLRTAEWDYYYMDVADSFAQVKFDIVRNSRDRVDLYVKLGGTPTLNDYDFRLFSFSALSEIEIDEASSPKLESGRYYVGVHRRVSRRKQSGRKAPADYELTGNLARWPSSRPGMGATPFDGGATFRVWAPFAEAVSVAGSFNSWNPGSSELVSEGNGFWSLDQRRAGPGNEYLYVIENNDTSYWRTDPYEEQVTNSVGNSVIANPNFQWTDGGFVTPTWNEMLIYEMHVGTFNEFDHPGGRPATFDDAIQRLPHIAQLGFNSVCVMPICEFAGDRSWGYNGAYPFAVEEAYGGPEAFKRFVDAAHSMGIAVILDVLHNHWGPSDLDMWQFDGWSENGRGGIYFYQDDRANTDWGDTRPDYGRQEVRQYIRDNIMMWLFDYHVDGIRWDSVHSTRTTNLGDNPEGWGLMQWINDEVNFFQPWAIMIGEDMRNNRYVTRETWEGGAGFDAQWSGQFVHPVRAAITGQSDDDRDMWAVKGAVEQRYNSDAFERVIFTESHDEVANGRSRVPEEIWPGNSGSWFSKKRSTLGAALVFTSPGIPMIFQGQEFLEDGYFQDTTPLDWSRAATFSGINQLYTDLARLRRNWFNNTRGLRGQNLNFFHTNNGAKVVAFHRWDQGGSGDDVIVILNFRDQAWNDYRIGLPRGGVWKVRFNSDWNGYSQDFGNFYSPDVTANGGGADGLDFSGTFSIAPYSVLILSQD